MNLLNKIRQLLDKLKLTELPLRIIIDDEYLIIHNDSKNLIEKKIKLNEIVEINFGSISVLDPDESKFWDIITETESFSFNVHIINISQFKDYFKIEEPQIPNMSNSQVSVWKKKK